MSKYMLKVDWAGCKQVVYRLLTVVHHCTTQYMFVRSQHNLAAKDSYHTSYVDGMSVNACVIMS